MHLQLAKKHLEALQYLLCTQCLADVPFHVSWWHNFCPRNVSTTILHKLKEGTIIATMRFAIRISRILPSASSPACKACNATCHSLFLRIVCKSCCGEGHCCADLPIFFRKKRYSKQFLHPFEKKNRQEEQGALGRPSQCAEPCGAQPLTGGACTVHGTLHVQDLAHVYGREKTGFNESEAKNIHKRFRNIPTVWMFPRNFREAGKCDAIRCDMTSAVAICNALLLQQPREKK